MRQPRSALVRSAAALLGLMIAVLASSCSISQESDYLVERHPADNYPQLLSDWNLLLHRSNQLLRATDTLIYEINTPLFADYTSKLRTLTLPAGTLAEYHESDSFAFPVGTVISKTFYYDTSKHDTSKYGSAELFADPQSRTTPTKGIRLLETRLLVHQTDGWHALPYVWSEDQRDAQLRLAGAITRINGDHYIIPSRDECANCHGRSAQPGGPTRLHPIGMKARHLYRVGADAATPGSSPAHTALGTWLRNAPVGDAVIANALWQPQLDPSELTTADLAHRARSYLDINCGHCHNPQGNADTSSLYLDYADHPTRTLGRCKPPVAAGKGTGGNLYSIVPGAPDASILIYRMASLDPGAMMPELGRNRVHVEGVALISEWIRRQTGACR